MTRPGSSESVRLDRLAVGSALFFALAAAAPLFVDSGFLATRGIGDSPNLLFRVQQLLAAWSGPVLDLPLLARWMPDADYGFGFPYFTYYASFSTHLAALLKLYGFSFVNAIKLTQALALLTGSIGMYLWVRRAGLRRAPTVLAAAAYTFAPFHLVNLYVRGDSLAELWAMAWYPLALWAAHGVIEQATFKRAVGLAALTAALICTHNISALNFMPFLGLYLLLHLRRASLLPAACCLLSLLWGLALSAFFWLPALAESGYVQLGELTTGFFHYSAHFRGAHLLQTSPLADYQNHPVGMGLAQTLAAALGLAALLGRALRQRRWSRFNTFVLLGLGLSTLMATPLSQPLWEALPLIRYTQFPWRFLSIQALFTAALTAFVMDDGRPTTDDGGVPSRVYRLSSVVIGLALAVSALAPLRLDFFPLSDADVTAARLNLYEYFSSAIGNTVNAEYLPKWVTPRPFTSDVMLGRAPRLKVLGGAATGERLWKRGAAEQWRIEVTSAAATLAVPTHYWPGWQAEVDGAALEVRPEDGLGWIAFELPPGAHTVTLRLGHTPLRLGAELFSLSAFLIPLAAFLYHRRVAVRSFFHSVTPSPRHPVTLSALFGISLLGFVILRLLPDPPASLLPLSMDFDARPYAYHDVVRFADGTELRGVQYSADHLRRGDTLSVTTHWQPARSGTAYFRLAPAPAYPAVPLPGASATLDAALTPETSLTVAFVIPADIPPGVYFVTVEIWDEQGPHPALTSAGQARGQVYLAPVWIDDEGIADEPITPPLAEFGPVRLITATVSYEAGDLLSAHLRWQAVGEVARNYALALRVRDTAGNQWGDGGDMQTAFGFYPTSMWRTGEQVPDYYRVRLNGPGEPPGDYYLAVTMYDVETLQPIGEARIPFALNRRHPREGRAAQFDLTADLGLERVEFPAQAGQGDALPLSATWLTGPQPNPRYRARWSLFRLDEVAAPVYTHVLELAPGSPTDGWPLDAYLLGRARLPLPADLAPGKYRLSVQLVDENENLVGAAGDVGSFEVTGRARDFTLPPYQVEVGASFDGQLKLWGYDAERTESELRLTLVWGALARPRGDYKFFVHLFNKADGFVAAQADAVPRDFTYPTTLWAEGEVVTDTISLNLAGLAPGDYGLAIGWYDPNTVDLARLPAFDAQDQRLEDDRVILPLEVRRP